jgi:hypothetical protein
MEPAHRYKKFKVERSAKRQFVILSETKDLVFKRFFGRLRSLRMTKPGIFAEVSSLKVQSQRKASLVFSRSWALHLIPKFIKTSSVEAKFAPTF